jgi:hypothetical protein
MSEREAQYGANIGGPLEELRRGVYEKFKHLDHLLSDERWLGEDNPRAAILRDLWLAVKEAVDNQEGRSADAAERSNQLTPEAYRELIEEDIRWLRTVPYTRERDHVVAILKAARATPPHLKYSCPTHGWWDASRESGCPGCVAEMRGEN